MTKDDEVCLGDSSWSDEVAKDLKTVVDHFANEDLPVRQIQVRFWKRLKFYWNNFSQSWWSTSENTYKVWGRDQVDSDGATDQAYYDRPVNVFKAFLETIIAALSVQIPVVSCVPDDADNPLDISTAKAGNMISQQIYKHNNVILLWLKALYVYCTEGMVACYTYVATDEEYGTYRKKKIKNEEVTDYFCPVCKQQLDEESVIQAKLLKESEENKFDPEQADSQLEELNDKPEVGTSQPIVCPQCSVAISPELGKTTLMIPRFDGYTTHPKSRICMDVMGGLYVKVANYARNQKDTPYLDYTSETHYTNVLKIYPDLRGKISTGSIPSSGSADDPLAQYSRLNIQYRGTYPEENVSVKYSWLRPSAFLILDEECSDRLTKKFPDGVRVVKVNDVVASYKSECLDDHWTLTENPMSDYLTHEPLGELLVNIQDIVNDLISLTLQTIEQGIPMTWVDPALVDVNEYGQIEATPGNIAPTKTVGGSKSIKDGFHTTTTASLSPEVFSFYRIIQELGQFVSGALPSLFGGAQQGGGDTASEYAMAKGMALQRLQTPWKMLTIWWKKIFAKAIPMYMDIMVEDERVVQKDPATNNYINVFIRKSELGGKIGDIELENSDKLPLTDDEQKDVIMQLIALNNAEVFSALTSPENLPFIRKVVRIPQFRLPGEDDRQKAYEEINELVNTSPIPIPQDPMAVMAAKVSGQPDPEQFESSIPIDPILDNHQISAEIYRGWLTSEAGRLCKKENPAGYQNVLLKLKAHLTEMNKQMMMAQMQNGQNQNTQDGKSVGKKQAGPEKIKTGKENAPVS